MYREGTSSRINGVTRCFTIISVLNVGKVRNIRVLGRLGLSGIVLTLLISPLINLATGLLPSDHFLRLKNSSHGLRWNFVQKTMQHVQEQGFSYDKSLRMVSEQMGHNRKKITEHYLR